MSDDRATVPRIDFGGPLHCHSPERALELCEQFVREFYVQCSACQYWTQDGELVVGDDYCDQCTEEVNDSAKALHAVLQKQSWWGMKI